MFGPIRKPSPATALALVAILLAVGGGDTVATGAQKVSKLISGKRIQRATIDANRLTPAARRAVAGAPGASFATARWRSTTTALGINRATSDGGTSTVDSVADFTVRSDGACRSLYLTPTTTDAPAIPS